MKMVGKISEFKILMFNRFFVFLESNSFSSSSSSSSTTASNRKKRQSNYEFPSGPHSLDWRERGAVTEAADQGFYCASCWAFAAVGALESHNFLVNEDLKKFSEQNLIDCNHHRETGN